MTDHHEHAPIAEALDDFVLLERAVTSLLQEKGVFSEAQFRRMVDTVVSRTPMLGARLVARAWVDERFRTLLLVEPKKAAKELLDIDLPEHPEISVLENTELVHHVVVCTLCSCYPKALLGLPPDWYKSFSYRSRMVRTPREVLSEFGTSIPQKTELRVVDSNADLRYLVIPRRPPETESWSEQELLAIITRDAMIGVTHPSTQK